VFTASILDGFSLFPAESRATNGDRLVTCDAPWGSATARRFLFRRPINRDFSEAVKLIILIVITLSA
jgi:hypothetical protein